MRNEDGETVQMVVGYTRVQKWFKHDSQHMDEDKVEEAEVMVLLKVVADKLACFTAEGS